MVARAPKAQDVYTVRILTRSARMSTGECRAMTDDELNALRRCEAAEGCTSPYGPTPARITYIELSEQGLIHWAPRWRLTEKGRRVLANLSEGQR